MQNEGLTSLGLRVGGFMRRKDLAESSVFAKDSQEMKGTDVQTDAPGGGMLGHGVYSARGSQASLW